MPRPTCALWLYAPFVSVWHWDLIESCDLTLERKDLHQSCQTQILLQTSQPTAHLALLALQRYPYLPPTFHYHSRDSSLGRDLLSDAMKNYWQLHKPCRAVLLSLDECPPAVQ